MGAITPASVVRENVGSLNLLMCKFTSVDPGDTNASSHSGIANHWAQINSIAHESGQSLAIGTSDNATGTITFTCSQSDHAVTLYLLVRD